jgi:hypothetical protein
MISHVGLLIALTSLFASCSQMPQSSTHETRKVIKTSDAPTQSPAVEERTLKALDSLGGQGTFLVVLDPREWAAGISSLDALGSILPVSILFMLKSQTSLGMMLTNIAGPRAMTEGWFKELDETRPLVASMYETVIGNEPGDLLRIAGFALDSSKPAPAGRAKFGLHSNNWAFQHTLLIPARDPKALKLGLSKALGVFGAPFGDYWLIRQWIPVAMDTTQDAVRVRILVPMGMKIDREDATTLFGQKRGTRQPRTPAYRTLGQRGSLVRVLLRTWRLRPYQLQTSMMTMTDALKNPNIPKSASLDMMLGSTATYLISDWLMTSAAPEFDDHAVGLSLSADGLRVEQISSVTPMGQRIYSPGPQKEGRAFELKRPVIAEFNYNIGSMTTPGPEGAWPVLDTSSEAYQDANIKAHLKFCGQACVSYLGIQSPSLFSLLNTRFALVPALPKIGLQPNLISGQLALIDISKKGPIFAAAMVLPKTAEVTPMATGLAGIEIKTERIIQGEHQVILFGVGIAPRDVFDVNKKRITKKTWSLTTNLKALRQSISAAGIKAPPVLSAIKGIDATGQFNSGKRIIQNRFRVSLVPLKDTPLPKVHVNEWASPVHGYTKNLGHDCARNILRPLFKLFRTVRGGYDGKLSKKEAVEARVNQVSANIRKDLLCMDKYKESEAISAGVRRYLKGLKARYEAAPTRRPPTGKK